MYSRYHQEQSTMWELPVVLTLLAAIIALRVSAPYYRRHRTLTGLALRMQMRFSQQDRVALIERLTALHLMKLGHSGRCFNIIYGIRHNQKLFVFDYAYETGSGQNRSTQKRQVFLCKIKTPLPPAVARRDELFEPLGTFRHFAPMNTGDLQFDRRFRLYTDQGENLRETLSQPVRGVLGCLQLVDWEFNEHYVAFYSRKLLAGAQITRLINRTVQCARLLERTSYARQASAHS